MPTASRLLSGLRRGSARRVAVWGAVDRRAQLLLDPIAGDDLRHGRLAGAGPFDLIVDATGLREGAEERFRTTFLHLVEGGTYRLPRDFAAAVEHLAAGSTDTPLGAAIGGVRRRGRWLEVRRRGRTLAKLREPEMNVAIEQDPSRGEILASVAGVSFDSRASFRASRPGLPGSARVRYDAPELYLREYRDVVCRPKSVVEQRGLLTPDTFRHHQQRTLTHKVLQNAGPGFAVAPARAPQRTLDGTFFHLDNEIRGFFGHALTEQARLWAWQVAKERDPDVRALVSVNRGRPVAEWEWTLMEAGGVRRDDVVVIKRPVRVGRLLAATPMFSMPEYVHPNIVQTWDEVGANLREACRSTVRAQRIFCSRRHDKRACLNREEVEKLFSDFGFEVVFPEDLPLPDQVEMFHQADVIAGFAGSAMFTTMFTDRRKHLLLVSSDTYRPTNEYMIASVRGHRLDVAIGTTPDVLPDGVPRRKALRWPFRVDMDHEGAWLREVLEHL